MRQKKQPTTAVTGSTAGEIWYVHERVVVIDRDQQLVVVRDTAAGVLEHDLVIPRGIRSALLHGLCAFRDVAKLELDIWILHSRSRQKSESFDLTLEDSFSSRASVGIPACQ